MQASIFCKGFMSIFRILDNFSQNEKLAHMPKLVKGRPICFQTPPYSTVLIQQSPSKKVKLI